MRSEARPLVFGEVLVDRFPDGTDVLGGAPFNVARHLHAFGLAPLLITRVGQDADGERVVAAMSGWGMDTAGVQVDPVRPTGEVRITLTGGEPAYDIVADVAYDHIAAAELPDLADCGLAYHGSLALRQEASAGALDAAVQATGARRFVDVNLRAPWWEKEEVLGRIRGAGGLKLNTAELDILFADHDPAGRLAAACDLVAGPVVLTAGEAGATAHPVGGAGPVTARPVRVARVVDTVGAGDAFCSVFLAGMLAGWPLDRTMRRAQDFASAIVGIRGAIPGDDTFYRPFLAAWQDED